MALEQKDTVTLNNPLVYPNTQCIHICLFLLIMKVINCCPCNKKKPVASCYSCNKTWAMAKDKPCIPQGQTHEIKDA